MQITTADGVELACERSGRGPCLVLVHGSWSDRASWASLVAHLAPFTDVVTYDRRGHGASTDGRHPGHMRDDVSDLCRVVEALDVGPVHVAASSFGASIALRAAAEHPDLFLSVSAHEPPLHALLDGSPADVHRDVAAVAASVEAVLSAIRAGDDAAGAQAFIDAVAFGPGSWERLPDALRRTFVANAPTFLEEQEDPEWSALDADGLASTGVPIQLSVGTATRPAHRGPAEALVAQLPDAHLAWIEGAGHVPHISHPTVLAQVIRTFTGTVDPPGAASGDEAAVSD